jgi:hypothetical protein
MKRQHNSSCIYTGKVGARMRPLTPRPSRRVTRRTFVLKGGPLAGCSVPLDAYGGHNTLPLAPMAGHPAGCYQGAHWVPFA